MAQQSQLLKPQTLNLDTSPKYLKESESPYLLNYDIKNPSSVGKAVPNVANISMCEMDMPSGDTFSVGKYSCKLTNAIYYWQFNSNGINFIQRLNDEGICSVVYTNTTERDCLKLSANPKNEIKEGRVFVHVEKSDCANRHGVYLIWTNGEGDIGCIDVEASLATNSFSTPFFDNCSNPCDFIKLAVPQSCGCVTAEYIPLTEENEFKTNQVLDKSFQFAFRDIYYDRRASEWSDPSKLYYQNNHSCFDSIRGTSRGLRLSVPLGNAMVEKVEIAYRENGGSWRLYDTVNKYKKYNSTQQYWYERELSESIVVDGCNMLYDFYNDKQCVVIDQTEFSRVYNPIPYAAQGLLSIEDALGAFNYEQGSCPIDQIEVKKFNINPVYNADADCVPEMRTLKVRAIIYSPASYLNQFIWRKGGALDDTDDAKDIAWFGGFQVVNLGSPVTQVNAGHEQSYNGSIRNFIVYIDGTQYFAEMKQYISTGDFNAPNEVGVLAGQGLGEDFVTDIEETQDDGDFYYQEATLLIPKGMQGVLRITSHKATGLEPDTSTKVAGVIDDINDYVRDVALTGFNRFQFEIPFGCDDTDLVKTFIIADATSVNETGKKSAVETVGYVKDNIGTPLEGLQFWVDRDDYVGTKELFATTDHNGYYYMISRVGRVIVDTAEIRAEIDCGTWRFLQKAGALNRTGYGKTLPNNVTVANSVYLNNKFQKISAKVVDCNSNPIEGVTVSFSGSKAQKTQADGVAYIKARNYSTRNRVIKAVVMSKYGCYTVDCDSSCNPCAPSESTTTPSCYEGENTNLSPMTISVESALSKVVGLKSGGNYPFGFIVKGGTKVSAVNKLENITIKKTQEKGQMSFNSFEFDATGIILPEWAECVKIVRGENLNPYPLQWLVDKIEKTADRKLKITIQSLNDYNKKFFFKTNTNYQYQDGDRVEFIRNGDGNVFNSTDYGLLNYQILSPFLDQLLTGETTSEANFFNQILIEDDGKLEKLKEGALIELQRSKECTTEPIYYSICASIPAYTDIYGRRRLVAETGQFTTFDTYYVQRQVGKYSTQTFEHHTPSDFWGGTGISDLGKAYFPNEFETQKRVGRNLSIGSPTQLNYFGDIIKTFDAPEHGDITAMQIVDGSVILAIGENDTFLAQVSKDLVRVGQDGIIRASAPDQIISDAQPKLRGAYGCQYNDIGSVLFGDGFVSFIDGNKSAHVVHNFNEAKDVSEGKIQTWVRKQIRAKKSQLDDISDISKLRWVSGINLINDTAYLTIKALTGAEIGIDQTISYSVNTNRGWRQNSESMAEYLSFHSFIPEGYGYLPLKDEMGCAFVSFFKGIPYLHPVKNNIQNTFYGIPNDMLMAVSANKFPEKLKSYIAFEVQSDQMWFVKEVTTDKKDFISEVPPIKLKQLGNKWNASLLGNKNSREGLYSGRMPSGYYCLITFIRDNSLDLIYESFNKEKTELYSEVDMVSVKFSLLESSGNTENL